MTLPKSLLLAPFVVLALSGCSNKPDLSTPNVVLIFIDDLGYGDLSCYGATGYETPNLDKLASNGMRFTHFYAAQAVCSASRAGLLTGCYPNRIGFSGALGPNAKVGISEEEMTIAELLKQKQYATAIFGKWHLGHHFEFLPLQHGFDEYLGLPYSNDMWPVDFDGSAITSESQRAWKANYPVLPLIEGNERSRDIRTLQDQDQLTTLYTERAVQFIENHHDEPFFLYLPHSMVHVPLGVSDKFRGKSQQGLFGDVMMEVDWSVGEVINTLERLNLRENTLVIFTSDNGPWLNFGNHAGNTGGLREGKGTSFEGGQREPCIMSWPAVIPKGAVTSQLAGTIDILPTLAEITGTSLPVHQIDGINILPILQGDKTAEPRKVFYYYYNRNDLEGIRMGQWKIVLPHSHRSYVGVLPENDGWPGPYAKGQADFALYNLRRDPGEVYDVQQLYPEVVAEMMILVNEAREDLGDALVDAPGKNRREPGRVQ